LEQTRALEPEDLAILSLERATIVGHTCKVILLSGPALTRDALLDRLAARIQRTPLLQCRLDDPVRASCWVPDDGFDLGSHLLDWSGHPSLDPSSLLRFIAQQFVQRLDRGRPLWSMDLVTLQGGGTALVWRIHHALADGATTMHLAELLLWDGGSTEEPLPPGLVPRHQADDARRRANLAGLLHREFGRQTGASPFDGTVGAERQVALATVSLPDLHRAARSVDGATVNDALLTVLAGALRRWLAHQDGRLDNVRVRVPVSLHHDNDQALNRDSYFSLELPLSQADPIERLVTIHRATGRRKQDADAGHLDLLYHDLGVVSPQLKRWATNLEDSPRRFALSVSNVPGPSHPISLLDRPVTGLFGLAEIGERHALRVAAESHADQLSFGLCADPTIVPDLGVLASALEAEAQALTAAADDR
jgi:diacylglycerol O-acyltransferase